MSGHTPGPWTAARAKYRQDGEFDFAVGAVIDGAPRVIAEAFGRVAEHVRPNAEANANLIAAAPHLIEAARLLLAGCRDETFQYGERLTNAEVEHLNGAILAFKAAIDKAEGKP